MKNLSKLNKFEQEAESMLNYYGSHDDMIGANYGGNGYIGESYMGGSSGLETINEADRTLTIVISNTNTSGTATAIVFGRYTYPTLTQPSGVTVSIPESSHDTIRDESMTNVMFFKGLKYRVTDEDQFDQQITLVRKTGTGGTNSNIWQPLNFRSAQNQVNTQIDAPQFQFLVDGRSHWEVPIKFGTTATFVVTIKTRSDQSNVLRGKGVTTIATAPTPTGLPQIDLNRR